MKLSNQNKGIVSPKRTIRKADISKKDFHPVLKKEEIKKELAFPPGPTVIKEDDSVIFGTVSENTDVN